MNSIATLALKEMKSAFRDHVLLIIVALFLFLSVVSVYIGSSTKNAELQAYQNIVQMLHHQGATQIPAAPDIHPLSVLKNIISYVSMVGAVVAIFLGFEAFGGERTNGTLKLIAVRPLYQDHIVSGKMAGAALIIGALLTVILIFNLILFAFVSGVVPGLSDLLRLLIFFLVAYAYMMTFYTASMYASIRSNNSAFVFMLMMIVWLTVSFVLPQVAESQRSFAYALNSTAQTVTQVPSDTVISKTIELFSPAAQLRIIGQDLLQVSSGSISSTLPELIKNQLASFLVIVLPGVALLLASYKAVQKEGVL